MYKAFFSNLSKENKPTHLNGYYDNLLQISQTCNHFSVWADVYDGLIRVCTYDKDGKVVEGSGNWINNSFHLDSFGHLTDTELDKRLVELSISLQKISEGRVKLAASYKKGFALYAAGLKREASHRSKEKFNQQMDTFSTYGAK